MKARLIQAWRALQESYWLLPSLFSLGALVAAIAAIVVDQTFGPWSLDWLPGVHPDGARALLSTVAGSMITVAGVAISVTLVALATTSTQFGPRLLNLFLRDRGLQATIGFFSASFLYSLVVLPFVRAPLETTGEPGEPFVPQIALLLAFLGAILSVGAFIYLVHHVAQLLHVGNVVARAGKDLLDGIEALERRLSPEERMALPDLEGDEGPPSGDSEELRARGEGYLQVIDDDALLELAEDIGRVVSVDVQVGQFVIRDERIARAWPSGALSDGEISRFHDAFAWGARRTYGQDLTFQVEQIVQIAARALSTGVNDPFTAMTCMDWLEAAVNRFSAVEDTRWLKIGRGDACIFRRSVTLEEFMEAAVGQMVPYAAGDVNAARHLAHSLESLAETSGDSIPETVLSRLVMRLRDQASARLDGPDSELEGILDSIGTN